MDYEPETTIKDTLRKHLSGDGVQMFSILMRVQAKQTCDRIEEGNIVLTFVRSAWLNGYSVPTLESYDWRQKKLIVKEGSLGKRWCQCISGIVCFRPTKKARSTVD